MVQDSPQISEISNPWVNQVEPEANTFWEVLNGLNLDVFNGIEAELLMFNESYHLRNVINYLKNSVDDFPPEFFLQQPNIVDRLMNIMHKVPEKYSIEIIKIVRLVINKLRDRCLESIKQKQDCDNSVVSIKKQVNNILQFLTNFFEGFHVNFSVNLFVKSQNLLNEIYFLLLSAADFIMKTNKACEIFINNLIYAIKKIQKISFWIPTDIGRAP